MHVIFPGYSGRAGRPLVVNLKYHRRYHMWMSDGWNKAWAPRSSHLREMRVFLTSSTPDRTHTYHACFPWTLARFFQRVLRSAGVSIIDPRTGIAVVAVWTRNEYRAKTGRRVRSCGIL